MSKLTKDELQELIIKNPSEFNEIKDEYPDVDLSESDFSGLTLDGIDFTDADLVGASFAESTLNNANFTNCDLTSCDFTRASCQDCNFSESLLNGTDFSYSTLEYCDFTDTDMAGSIFQGANVSESDFSLSVNLNACRFDEETVWPDTDKLPDDFDTGYVSDLAQIDDEDGIANKDY